MTLGNETFGPGYRTARTVGDKQPVHCNEMSALVGTRVAVEREARPQLNRAIGFTSLLLGVASGMILGLWSFGGPLPVPEGIGGYDELARRFLRLGHIAFFGLGLINLAIAGHCSRLNFSPAARRRALLLINLGNVGLPPLLLAAAWQPVLLYLMPLPVVCVFTALLLTAAAAWRSRPPETF